MITMPPAANPQEQQAIIAAVDLIDAPGPFLCPRDGIEFKNWKAQLPLRPAGHYREYTVPSSGVTGRGARRIVQGATAELFYSAGPLYQRCKASLNLALWNGHGFSPQT